MRRIRLPIGLLVTVLVIFLIACRDAKRYHDDRPVKKEWMSPALQEIDSFQQQLNAQFRDPDKSPLPDRYRKSFNGLDFFEADTNYRVWAHLEYTPDAVPFLMPTTTDRKSTEVVYAIAHFTINGEPFELEIYQNRDLLDDPGNADYLFLPFLDETNGKQTYAGGRYIDLRIPEGDSILIDFNMAYNPYCVYNKKYSCPIVPKVNALPVPIIAGVKNFKSEK
ncbi:MAG: DUF1684 domain-containing protein [Eudoraea sp.]|nr:DUF1684 domain-containing protein [Eudoraea sp.]